MYAHVSNLFWLAAAPSNLIFFLIVAGALALGLRWSRTGKTLVITAALVCALAGPAPTAAWLLRPLEDRFARPDLDGLRIDGIIVLGGAMDEPVTHARARPQLNEYGSRMAGAAALALRHRQARIVFSGGARSASAPMSEAEAARTFFVAMGIEPARLAFEDRSRNTHENAMFTQRMIEPGPGETWVLVTSAFHMPRAVGAFRRAGMEVIAYPADYKTRGLDSDYWRISWRFGGRLRLTDIGVREWIGLIAYRWSDRTDALLPAP